MSLEVPIFVLDLDGTIIGCCSYQTILFNLENILKKHHKKLLIDHLTNSYKQESRLIRPHFKYFYNKIKTLFPNCLIFIYTASEKKWAHREITLIEKTHNIKFDRPIFTRDDCIINSGGNYIKSIKKIIPKILKKNKEIKEEDINNRLLVIDNNNVYIDYNNNFLLCPTYDYVHFIDVWSCIDDEYLKIAEINNAVNSLIINKKMSKICTGNYKKLLPNKYIELRYKWLYKRYKKINDNNKKYLNDEFWKKLTNAIFDNKITTFDKNSVHLLQNKTI